MTYQLTSTNGRHNIYIDIDIYYIQASKGMGKMEICTLRVGM